MKDTNIHRVLLGNLEGTKPSAFQGETFGLGLWEFPGLGSSLSKILGFWVSLFGARGSGLGVEFCRV